MMTNLNNQKSNLQASHQLNHMIDIDFSLKLGDCQIAQQFQSNAQVVGLFGASGSGKTTILHCIAGLLTPQSGHICINGNTWFDAAQRILVKPQQRRVGLVFQDAQLFPHQTVMQNLIFGYQRLPKDAQHIHPEEMIELFKLEHLLKRMPLKLSGGEKQRVALARALLYSPQLLLLDEPLSALDAAHKAEILPFFQKIQQDFKIPMLYVSHDINEIQQLTETIWRL